MPNTNEHAYHRFVKISCNVPGDLAIRKTYCTDSRFKTELTVSEPGRVYLLWITIPTGINTSAEAPVVIVETDAPAHSQLRIPIRFYPLSQPTTNP